MSRKRNKWFLITVAGAGVSLAIFFWHGRTGPLRGKSETPSGKSEIRNPKSETNSNSQIQNSKQTPPVSDFDIRASDFPRQRAQDRFAVEEGGRLYARYCLPCHGESGRGDGRFYASSLEPTPADFTDPTFLNSHTDRQLHDAIVGGSASMGKSDLCPSWGKTFSSTEVDYLIGYIRQLQQNKESARVNTWP